jgi:hypothetical protein
MDPLLSLAPEGTGASGNRSNKLPLQYYFVKQVIGSKDNKPVFMKKVLAVYPKGLKVVHATTSSRTMKELNQLPLLKFVDIREFHYVPEKSIFRFFYRTVPSNDPLPLATDLQYEFELALVSELNKTIDLALERLAAKRQKIKRSRAASSPNSPTVTLQSPAPTQSSERSSSPVASSSMVSS